MTKTLFTNRASLLFGLIYSSVDLEIKYREQKFRNIKKNDVNDRKYIIMHFKNETYKPRNVIIQIYKFYVLKGIV